MIRALALLCSLSFLSQFAYPQTGSNPPVALKRHNFGLGVGLDKLIFHSNNDFSLTGNSVSFSVGHTYLGDLMFVQTSGLLITGPFNPNDSQNYENQGAGAMLRFGISAQGQNIRSKAGSYGFLLGGQYTETYGESIQKSPNANPYTIEKGQGRVRLKSRGTLVLVTPGLFFANLQEARPDNLEVPNLVTRVEGYIWDITFLIPIVSSYKINDMQAPENSSKGSLHGYGVMISIQILLGV